MVCVCVHLIWVKIYKPADFILDLKSRFLASLEKWRNLVTLESYSSRSVILQTWGLRNSPLETDLCFSVLHGTSAPSHALSYLLGLRQHLSKISGNKNAAYLPTCSSLHITKWESTLGWLIWISLPTSCVVHGPAASTWSGSLWEMQASQALPQAFWIRITILRFPRWFLRKLQFEKPWVTTSFEEVTFQTFPFIIIPGSNLQTRNVLPVSVFLLKLNP